MVLASAVLLVAAAWLYHVCRPIAGTTDPHKIAVVSAVYGGAATEDSVTAALRQVRVIGKRPFPGGYDRDCDAGGGCSFGTAWTDATDAPDSGNGCDTRDDVLREQLVSVRVDPGSSGCKVAAGTLVDPYTGREVDFAKLHFDIDIDHVVPLAYAWDMGAAAWTQQQRDDFANDTSVELLASWGPANEEKGDSGPADWLPQDRAFRCDYVLRFLQAAVKYRLPITESDARAVQKVAREC